MVVLFHIRDRLPFIIINDAVEIGYAGVSFFFVLSGFILTYNYSGAVSRREFWNARFARVYPVYVVGLLLSLPFFVAVALRGEASWAAPLAALFLVQAWFPDLALALNPPGWSLSDEAFFYAVFPFAIRRLRSMTTRGALWLVAAAWLATLAVPVAYIALSGDRGLGPADHGAVVNAVKFNPVARLGEFIAGMAAGAMFLQQPRRPRPGLAAVAAIAIAVAISSSDRIPYLVLHNGLFMPAFVAIIFALATTDVPGLGSRLAGKLGEASYSLYILHAPVWMILTAIEKRRHLFGGALVSTYLVVIVVASLLAYRYIELPMRRRLRLSR